MSIYGIWVACAQNLNRVQDFQDENISSAYQGFLTRGSTQNVQFWKSVCSSSENVCSAKFLVYWKEDRKEEKSIGKTDTHFY